MALSWKELKALTTVASVLQSRGFGRRKEVKVSNEYCMIMLTMLLKYVVSLISS